MNEGRSKVLKFLHLIRSQKKKNIHSTFLQNQETSSGSFSSSLYSEAEMQ